MIYEKSYNTVQSFDCINACVLNYLQYYNKPILGSDIFFVGGGFAISYEKNQKLYIGSKVYKTNFVFLDKMNIKYERDNSQDGNSALKLIEHCIKNEKCICIRVASEVLEHSPVFKQTEGSSHYINIIGKNEINSRFYISDGYVPTYNPSIFEGWADCKEIMEAWNRMDYEYIVFDIDNIKIDISNIQRMAHKNLKLNLINYLYPNDTNCNCKLFGEYAVKILFQDIQAMFESRDISNIIMDINYQLKIFGFLTSKKFILEKIRKTFMDSGLCMDYDEIINRWNKLCLLLVKAGLSKDKARYNFVLVKTHELIHDERDILLKVISML